MEVLEAHYEVQKTDLQGKLLEDEDIDYLTFRRCLKNWIRLIKELKDELQAARSRKTLSPEADRNQLNPKVHSHS